MITAGDALREWTEMPRPLRALTKEQLFKYPLADGSSEGEWTFSKEILARVVAYREHEKAVAKAKDEALHAEHVLATIKATLARTRDKQAEAELHGQGQMHAEQMASLQRSQERAEAQIKKLQAKAAAMQEELDGLVKRDDLLSPVEVHSYYAHRYAGRWNEIMAAWHAGELLKAQKYGWLTFLTASKADAAQDREAFKEAEGIAVLVGQERGPTFTAMRALFQTRVMPPTADRREFLNDNDTEGGLSVAGLKPEQRRRYWKWWRAYNTMTVRFQWTDDSGAAYDERLFDPNKLRPEERDDD